VVHNTTSYLGHWDVSKATYRVPVKMTRKHPQPVNRSVSFHAINSEALNLLSKVLKKLRALFLTNPTLNKKKTTIPRNIKTARHLLHYYCTQRQHCF
jgi:hypothetical protein